MNPSLFVTVFIFLIGFLGLGAYRAYVEKGKNPGGPIACTLDAKICPDGTAVGRVAPRCEFAPCPLSEGTATTTPPSSTATSTPPTAYQTTVSGVKIGQTVYLGGIALTPLAIEGDSRCPVGVNCIWVGTVTLRVKLARQVPGSDPAIEGVLTLGAPFSYSGTEITLVSVAPPKSKTPIATDDYRFDFKIKAN